ncbi:hypothetical protein [Kineococcus arenarius]|uniref:hypothetical protein n=1 Tax=unclassified Kineococcus TaxID=2621656 RepID=UPI003D7D45FE
MLASFSVAVAIRMAQAAADLPRPRVSLVPAPSYQLEQDHDDRKVLDEPSFAVSLGLAAPLTSPHEVLSYPDFDTRSQWVSLGGTLLLLDNAMGPDRCEPRPARLRTEQDWGLRMPFTGWWVFPDFADELAWEVDATVLTTVKWAQEGRAMREAEVLVDFTLALLRSSR